MTITVACLGVPTPGRTQVDVEPQDTGLTLRSLILDHMSIQGGTGLAEALLNDRGLRPEYTVLVDGRNVEGGDLDMVIEDGSVVLITALVAGG